MGEGHSTGSGGAGKSVNNIKRQAKRILGKIDGQIKAAKAAGNTAAVAALQKRRQQVKSVAKRYEQRIARSIGQTQANMTTAQKNARRARSTYQARGLKTKQGAMGQYREAPKYLRQRGSTEGTHLRRSNLFKGAIIDFSKALKAGTPEARRGISERMNRMGGKNSVAHAAKQQAVRNTYSAKTNRKGSPSPSKFGPNGERVAKITRSNATNYRNAPLKDLVRIKRKGEKKAAKAQRRR